LHAVQAIETSQEGRLATAGRTNDADHLTAPHGDRDAPQGLEAPESLADVATFDDDGRAVSPGLREASRRRHCPVRRWRRRSARRAYRLSGNMTAKYASATAVRGST